LALQRAQTWMPAPDQVRGRLCAGMTNLLFAWRQGSSTIPRKGD